VLADVAGDVGVALARQLPEFLDHHLRLDDVAAAAVGQAVALAPLVDLAPPGGHLGRLGSCLRLADLRDQFLQHLLDVADDGDVDLDVLVDRRGIDIDLDLLRAG